MYEPKVVKTAAWILKNAAEWSSSKGEDVTMSFATDADLAYGSCDVSYYRHKPYRDELVTSDAREDQKAEIKVSYRKMEAPQALALFTEMKNVLDKAIEKIKKLTDGQPASGEATADDGESAPPDETKEEGSV